MKPYGADRKNKHLIDFATTKPITKKVKRRAKKRSRKTGKDEIVGEKEPSRD